MTLADYLTQVRLRTDAATAGPRASYDDSIPIVPAFTQLGVKTCAIPLHEHAERDLDRLLRICGVLMAPLQRISGFHANAITTVAADLARAALSEAERVAGET